MTFHEWWVSYKLPVISSRGTFDLLQKATRAAYNAGKRAARQELTKKRRSTWQTPQSSS